MLFSLRRQLLVSSSGCFLRRSGDSTRPRQPDLYMYLRSERTRSIFGNPLIEINYAWLTESLPHSPSGEGRRRISKLYQWSCWSRKPGSYITYAVPPIWLQLAHYGKDKFNHVPMKSHMSIQVQVPIPGHDGTIHADGIERMHLATRGMELQGSPWEVRSHMNVYRFCSILARTSGTLKANTLKCTFVLVLQAYIHTSGATWGSMTSLDDAHHL